MTSPTRKRGALCLALLSCLAAPGAALAQGARIVPEPPPRPAPGESALRGAVVVVLDSVRADHVSSYGYERETSPHLDALARQGARFETVVANAPWTLPSIVGLLSGAYPPRVFDQTLSSSLAEPLRAAGFQTAAFTEGGFVSRSFGFDRGFVLYEEAEGEVRLSRDGQTRGVAVGGGGILHTFARAREWLAAHRDERFFVFLHTYEPHAPYRDAHFAGGMPRGGVGDAFTLELIRLLQSGRRVLDPSERAYVTALYDGDIRAADRQVGELLAHLERIGVRDHTLVVVTSDHGEELGEHFPSRIGDHGLSLRDPLVRVPLVLHDPTRAFPVRQVAPQVRLLDVMPTVLSLLGVAPPEGIDGRSLLPLLRGEEEGERIALVAQVRGGPPRAGLRAMGFKYIFRFGPDPGDPALLPRPPERQLYDLRADPGERRNLAATHRELARSLHLLLEERSAAMGAGGRIPEPDAPELRARLRALGYLD